jgi:hypothetical protein
MTKSKKRIKGTKGTRKNNKCVYTDEVFFFKKLIKQLNSKIKKTKKNKKNTKEGKEGKEGS